MYRILSVLCAVSWLWSVCTESLPTHQIPITDSRTSKAFNFNSSVSNELFQELEEHARIVDISYCVGTTGIQKPFLCASRCQEFDGFELVTVSSTEGFGMLLAKIQLSRHGIQVRCSQTLAVILLYLILHHRRESSWLSAVLILSQIPSLIYQQYHKNTSRIQVMAVQEILVDPFSTLFSIPYKILDVRSSQKRGNVLNAPYMQAS